MQYFDNGEGFTVTASRYDVENFTASWPGSDLPDKAISFGFDNAGNLIDCNSDYDGSDLVALSEDCQQYGMRHKKQIKKMSARV